MICVWQIFGEFQKFAFIAETLTSGAMNSSTIYGHSDDKLGVIDDLASADRQFTLGYLFSNIFSSRRQYETISLPEVVKSAAYRKELKSCVALFGTGWGYLIPGVSAPFASQLVNHVEWRKFPRHNGRSYCGLNL